MSNNNLTELVFILDRSGSMFDLTSDTIGGFNSMIEKQKKQEGDCLVTTVLFSDDHYILHDRIKLTDVSKMTEEEYSADGCTALLDTIGSTIKHIEKIHKYARPEDVPKHTMFCITTDGMENASRKYDVSTIRKMIEKNKEKGWEFIFVGANMDAISVAGEIGIRKDRSATWSATKEGATAVYDALDMAVTCCRVAKPIGSKWKKSIK